jgi:hypothetical protein
MLPGLRTRRTPLKYDEEEFFRLMGEVQRQGGQHLDETHEHVYHPKYSGDKTTEGQKPSGVLKYCNSNALFDVPYLNPDRSVSPTASESIKVCAVDDCIGLWPRFAAANAPGRDHDFLNMGKPA